MQASRMEEGLFPSTLTGYKAGASQIHRVEWGVWTELSTSGEYPGLRYADYSDQPGTFA